MKKNQKGYINRSKLPSPESYYLNRGFMLQGTAEWKKTKCPFHDDTRPSLCINLKQGGCFRCHACGACGGDIIDFHMRWRNLTFTQAVKELGAWEVK